MATETAAPAVMTVIFVRICGHVRPVGPTSLLFRICPRDSRLTRYFGSGVVLAESIPQFTEKFWSMGLEAGDIVRMILIFDDARRITQEGRVGKGEAWAT